MHEKKKKQHITQRARERGRGGERGENERVEAVIEVNREGDGGRDVVRVLSREPKCLEHLLIQHRHKHIAPIPQRVGGRVSVCCCKCTYVCVCVRVLNIARISLPCGKDNVEARVVLLRHAG